MDEPRIIKRYSNRKLYDTLDSQYVTLEQVGELVRRGDDVRIVDNATKEDLTTVTLAQIIFEEEKRRKSFLSLDAMKSIIQAGGGRIEEIVAGAKTKVSSVFGRKSDPLAGEPPSADEQPPSPPPPAQGTLAEIREWLEQRQRQVEEWQHKVDEKVRAAVDSIPFAGLEHRLAALTARVAELEKRLEKLER